MYSRFSFLSILLGCGINLFAAAEELPPVPEIRDKGNKLVKNYLDAEFADTWLMVPGAPVKAVHIRSLLLAGQTPKTTPYRLPLSVWILPAKKSRSLLLIRTAKSLIMWRY